MNSDMRDTERELAKVALGQAEADLAIVNGDVVNVYTGEVLSGETVLSKGERIAYVGKNAGKAIGAGTRVIDASGKTLVPGFIDGHTHINQVYSISEFIKYALKGGTTSVITEVVEMAHPLGARAITDFLKAAKDQPLKFWITLPPMVTISPVAEEHAVTARQLHPLLRRKEVVGLGEAYWAPMLTGNQRVQEIINETRRSGKTLEGHSAGATANKLQAYASLGFSSCHEPTSAGEVLERVRVGIFVPIREGEIRRELAGVSGLKDRSLDFRLLGLCTDGVGPWQITTDGYLESVVQKAINLGFPPVKAIQMVTINVAQHFHLEDCVGGIAPGKYADIAIIPDIRTIRAEYVISNGRVMVQDGKLLVQPCRHGYPAWMKKSIHLDRDFSASDFSVPVDLNSQRVKVRVIDLVTNLVTKEAIAELAVSNGQVRMDTARDIIKVAAIERTYSTGKTFTGFIKGAGMKQGALAISAPWDTCDIIVIGADEADMALALNRLGELNGGIVACRGAEVLAQVPMPVGGVISLEPMEVLSSQLHRFQEAAAGLGCVLPDMRITMSTLTSGAIPYLRICESGLFNLRLNSFVDLFVKD